MNTRTEVIEVLDELVRHTKLNPSSTGREAYLKSLQDRVEMEWPEEAVQYGEVEPVPMPGYSTDALDVADEYLGLVKKLRGEMVKEPERVALHLLAFKLPIPC